jgi:hypothetical protein
MNIILVYVSILAFFGIDGNHVVHPSLTLSIFLNFFVTASRLGLPYASSPCFQLIRNYLLVYACAKQRDLVEICDSVHLGKFSLMSARAGAL